MAWRIRSIRTYFAVAAAGMASLTFLALIALVIHQVDHALSYQKAELETISDIRLASELDAQAQLAAARLREMFSDTERRLTAIAGRSDTASRLESRAVVAIGALLGPVARNANFDSILMIGPEAEIVGASSSSSDLIKAGQSLQAAPFFKKIQSLIKDNSRAEPKIYSQLLLKSDYGSLLPERPEGQVSHTVFVPLFDDFGDVAGGLLAQRWLRDREATLLDLSRIGSVGFAVYSDRRIVSKAGLDADVEIGRNQTRRTSLTMDGDHIARCAMLIPPLRICALKPIETLYATQNELTRIGKEQERSLFKLLISFGIAASLLLIGMAVVIAQRITRPLLRMTESLCNAAAGKYENSVVGIERADEVGDMAKAVVVLQASSRERDALRSNIEIKNTTLKQQEAELREQNALFDAALNNMSHGLCMFDANRRLIVSNQRYLELFDLKPDQAVPGMAWSELFAAQDADLSGTDRLEADALRKSSIWPNTRRSMVTYRLHSQRMISMTRQPLTAGGWVAIFEDVTEREQARGRLLYLASHDSLTDLPNRIRLRDHLENQLRHRDAEGGVFGILCLDLDEFKTVNDTLGHPIGDALLREVSERLLAIAGDGDLIARMGGDEFTIVVGIASEREKLEALAQSVIKTICFPYQLDQHEITIGVSIGIAVVGGEGVNADDLLKQGDLALYEAKNNGRNTYRFFKPEMETNVHLRRNLTTDLRGAIGRGELEAYFQPQINLATGEISGFEALMRWHHPEKGLVAPADFIPIAEETGLIVPIGEWILREACRIAASWPDHIGIAVNISVKQLQNSGFASTLVGALAMSGLAAARLELEVTESVLLSDDVLTRKTLLRAKELGVKISMDDFGTGYSSLSCLRSFPFDKIKIDQSFIRSMADSDDSASIVRAIIDLARSLKISTTAEGVETEDLVGRLQEIGCTEVQGYFYGRPEPAHEAQRLLSLAYPAPKAVING